MSEELGLESIDNSGEPGRSPINHRFLIAAAGILAVILLGLTLVLFVASRQGKLRIPTLGGSQNPKPTAAAIVKAASTVTKTPTPAKPSPTPPPTLGPTHTPTPLPPQIIVEGPSQYPKGLPYLAEYKLTYVNGSALSVTLMCSHCMAQANSPSPWVLKFDTPGTQAVRAVVMAGDTAMYVLRANGSDCLAWNLTPGDAEKLFKGVCAPTK